MQLISKWLFIITGNLKSEGYIFLPPFGFINNGWNYFYHRKETFCLCMGKCLSERSWGGGTGGSPSIAGVCRPNQRVFFFFFFWCTRRCLWLKENSRFVLSIWQNIPFCFLKWLSWYDQSCFSVVLPTVLSGPWRSRAAHLKSLL